MSNSGKKNNLLVSIINFNNKANFNVENNERYMRSSQKLKENYKIKIGGGKRISTNEIKNKLKEIIAFIIRNM